MWILMIEIDVVLKEAQCSITNRRQMLFLMTYCLLLVTWWTAGYQVEFHMQNENLYTLVIANTLDVLPPPTQCCSCLVGYILRDQELKERWVCNVVKAQSQFSHRKYNWEQHTWEYNCVKLITKSLCISVQRNGPLANDNCSNYCYTILFLISFMLTQRAKWM